jgi:CRISPR/Cas system-associated endonuclease Cas1
VKWQIATRKQPKKRMEFCVSLITKKIEASIQTLEKTARRSNAWEKAMQRAYASLTRLDENPPKNVSERALEANSAALYFRAWRGMPIKWRGTSRRPIPESWKAIEQRTSPFQLARNRNAAHPVNAILNYAYRHSIVIFEAVSDWRRQWQAIDFAESGYGRAHDIDK